VSSDPSGLLEALHHPCHQAVRPSVAARLRRASEQAPRAVEVPAQRL